MGDRPSALRDGCRSESQRLLALSVLWGSSLSLPTLAWLCLVGWVISAEPISMLWTPGVFWLALDIILQATIASTVYFWLALRRPRHRNALRGTYALGGLLVPAVVAILQLVPSISQAVWLRERYGIGIYTLNVLAWLAQALPPPIALGAFGWLVGSVLDARCARRVGPPEAAAH